MAKRNAGCSRRKRRFLMRNTTKLVAIGAIARYLLRTRQGRELQRRVTDAVTTGFNRLRNTRNARLEGESETSRFHPAV
jgi:hypothetical protein